MACFAALNTRNARSVATASQGYLLLRLTLLVSLYVKVTCSDTCGKFDEIDEQILETCHPYLDNTTTYYLADSPWLDSPRDSRFGLSLVSELADLIKPVMSKDCYSNVASMICHAAFKECKMVEDVSTGGKIWLPALLCRGECEKRYAVWEECLADIEKDPKAKADFDTQMSTLVDTMVFGVGLAMDDELPAGPGGARSPFQLLSCDVPGGDLAQIPDENSAMALLLGQYPRREAGRSTYSLYFPSNMDPAVLYPEASSLYTRPDGTMLDVPCFTPGEAKEITLDCPDPFVNSIAKDSLEPCVQPCPVQAYSDSEYSLLWGLSMGIQLSGLFLNMFMVGRTAVQLVQLLMGGWMGQVWEE
jgi:hypothetical protein